MSRRYHWTMIAACLTALPTASSYGTNYTWAGGASRAWNLASNWNPNNLGYPSTGTDTVTIPDRDTTSNDPLVSSSITVGTVHVDDDGRLEIGNGGVLTASAITVDLIADFEMTGSGALVVNGSMTVAGNFVAADSAVVTTEDVHLESPGGYEHHGNVDSNVAGALVIDSGAFMSISDSAVVQLSGGSTSELPHVIDGTIELYDSSRFEITTNNAYFSGTGAIAGFSNTAVIDVASGKKMTLMTDTAPTPDDPFELCGNLVVQGAGEFDNDGVVVANAASGTLKLNTNTISGSGRWKASANLSVLRFETDALALTGGFDILSGGKLQLYLGADLATTGAFASGACGYLDLDPTGGGGDPASLTVLSGQGGQTTYTTDQTFCNPPTCSSCP